mgnify:CR=1 FL=1
MKKPLRHIFDYLVLTILISTAIVLILFFNGNKYYQELIIVGLSLSYIVWGVIHHAKEHTLQTRIILEYVLFSLLGTFLVMGLLK